MLIRFLVRNFYISIEIEIAEIFSAISIGDIFRYLYRNLTLYNKTISIFLLILYTSQIFSNSTFYLTVYF